MFLPALQVFNVTLLVTRQKSNRYSSSIQTRHTWSRSVRSGDRGGQANFGVLLAARPNQRCEMQFLCGEH
ncbi:hypothetical protein ANN_11906 [Periplaneta americana]|uniref:Secreted protein n=1 Tax=Periplaneta americana TaxID=6978 RepID=A0ABQ8T842_PERAM|nr:hypothetical protein ANN_11906 [Periplaneta americana]